MNSTSSTSATVLMASSASLPRVFRTSASSLWAKNRGMRLTRSSQSRRLQCQGVDMLWEVPYAGQKLRATGRNPNQEAIFFKDMLPLLGQ